MKYRTIKTPPWPITFRIYPENKSLYATVNIWPSKAAMYRHRPLQRTHEASCTGQMAFYPKRKGKQRKDGLFAELNFHRKSLGVGVVSHEITHAAFSWAERRRIPLAIEHTWYDVNAKRKGVLSQDSPEERFCYALGEMVRQFTERCYKIGVYK